jgi:NAD(P)-dependent dehydrogenase (short-subunit alcohol dehydrogenase family)
MTRNRDWTAEDMPDLTGKTAVVTGGNSGIGFTAARELARHRAHVILACRDRGKAQEAIAQIHALLPSVSLEAMQLDLASLQSVHRFADDFAARSTVLDLLINNAGVMAIPYRKTADGFEMQIGTNHLGHFALTGLLLPALLAAPAARIVNVSSTAHKMGRIDFDDLQSEKSYSKWPAYAQSKLANLLFTYELQRRLESAGKAAISVACHPGYAATNLQATGPRMAGSRVMEAIMEIGNRLFSQSAAMGALPTLYAATAPEVRGADYIGPDGFMENTGHPRKTASTTRSHDRDAARRLWQMSEELTAVRYGLLASAA